MSVNMTNVVDELTKVAQHKLESLPVSKDIPRLARKFTLFRYNKQDSTMQEKNFTADKAKDKINIVLFELMHALCSEIGTQSPGGASQEIFDTEVNTNIPTTFDKYLLKYYGENHAIIKLLKCCNQSPVIAVLFHVRECLKNHGIEFKDCRGMWFLDFHTGKDFKTPIITQRRIEQVYSISEDKSSLICKYKFEWEISIQFDTLHCDHITKIELKLKDLDYSGYSCPEKEKEESGKVFAKAFSGTVVDGLKIAVTGD
ncbi:hypothetical protein C9374_008588 [Naegleria lovaniensis]|uniref:Ras guanine nucleotide exchange factor glfB-like C-terminal domain-containing protein n=1 Tax=Naegleria lovaniensis TaxID=51637 RepID=A0AA88KH97_NAELO|nr:uncharacterized protein C9374_008588 [Naegleria lovaniensis]KAG2377966.1 hypothetical protein C9374_008588 [Naegleria lovaniensis]